LIFSFGLFTALNHAIGPQKKFGNIKYYVVEPLREKIVAFMKKKCGKKEIKDGEEAHKEQSRS